LKDELAQRGRAAAECGDAVFAQADLEVLATIG
jgi:hypothetical protein